jgi:hypothetical protein
MAGAVHAADFRLENSRVELTLVEDGKLVELTNLQTGHHYVEGGRAPWRMYYRLGRPMESGHEKQAPKSAVRA